MRAKFGDDPQVDEAAARLARLGADEFAARVLRAANLPELLRDLD